MSITYNPVQGPFPDRPARLPGTTIIIGTANGFILSQPSDSPRLAAPTEAAPIANEGPKQMNDHLTKFGEEALKGYKTMFADVQTTAFGRKWFGGKKQDFYLVDISRRVVADTIIVPSKESTLKFVMDVRADVEVIDPLRAVEKGVVDVWDYLATVLQRWLATVAVRYSVTELASVAAAINKSIDEEITKRYAFGTSIVGVQLVRVTVDLDEVARKYVREVEEAAIKKQFLYTQGEVEEVARNVQLAATQSPERLMAQWLQSKDPIYKEALEATVAALGKEDAKRVELMQLMLDKKMIADHDIHEKYPDLVERLFHQALPTLPSAPHNLKISDNSLTNE